MEKNCTPREKEELFALILQAEHDDTLRRLIAETWNEDHPSYPQDKSRADNILREIVGRGAAEPPPFPAPASVRSCSTAGQPAFS